MLVLCDLEGMDEAQVREHIASAYRISVSDLGGVEVLIGYESVGSWGCDSSNWFLFRKNGELFENHGSHCSCYGFEDQWSPESTSAAYLLSDKFYLSTGGYDDAEVSNRAAVAAELTRLFGNQPLEEE